MRITPAHLAALGILTVAGVPALTAQSGTYPIHGDDLAIYNLAGVLRVEPGTGTDVVVIVETGGSDAGRLKVTTGVLRGHDGLRVIYPEDVIVYPTMGRHSNSDFDVNDDGTFGDRGGDGEHRVRIRGDGSGLEAWADLTVKVPAGKSVTMHVGVGKATVTNVDGRIKVDLASADANATGAKGILGISTGSGDIHVTDATADLKLETGSGDVTVTRVTDSEIKVETGSGDVKGDHVTTGHLDLNSGSGSITVASVKAPDIALETGSGDVDIGLVDGVQTLEGNTGSGSITLAVPSTLGADVELDTGSGEIDLGGVEVKVRKLRNDHLSGTIGNGGGRIKLEAGSGDISLRKS
jgi:lia operon protein LiaG